MALDKLIARAQRERDRLRYGFAPAMAGEEVVFGARRPGFPRSKVPAAAVDDWIGFMRASGIAQVICLLSEAQLRSYPCDLLARYRDSFGAAQVRWAPIEDFTLVDEHRLCNLILPALFGAEGRGERAVVHCSGGIGRTGHILAAWLVARHGLANEEAIAAVRRTGRNPRESRDPRLDDLLNRCRQLFVRA